ncbi:MAG: enoyl-CoA hydratase-related protein [Gammaproteobacteria bacterium]|nr:enoyl-CoA hydratase-related protein [Gammaproteobacteria bacterium]
MNESATVVYEQPQDNVALVTLNRPDALNAINSRMRMELPVALNRAAGDANIRVLVLTGSGRAFSAGADLKDDLQGLDINDVLLNEYKPAFDAIIGMDKPVISAINGSASGIGLSLALVCDLSVMADDGFLLCPFSTINLIPDGGGNFLLARQMGYKRAYQMAIEADRLPASRALELGLVNRLVAADRVREAALEWAGSLASRAPQALARTKKIMRFAMANNYDDTFRQEAAIQSLCFASEDFSEGRNAFIQKRRAVFKGK